MVFIKHFSIGALILGALIPTSSFAKWTFSDQVNLANRKIAEKVNEINEKIKTQSKETGFYIPIPYRQNDVFVFCKEGPNTKEKDYYWKPTNGVGQFTITDHKKYVYDSGSWDSTAYYLTVCPYGKQSGNWNGPGSGGDYKGNKEYVSPPTTTTGPAQKGKKLDSFIH